MPSCRICKTNYDPFLSFGNMPIANGFLTKEQFDAEYFFELQVGFCPECKMVQIVNQPNREMMFHENYAFYSSTSQNMKLHFKQFAETVMKKYLPSEKSFVVELGSNDGIMLKNFASAGHKHLGIEPSANVAKAAIENGVNTICEFFDEDLAHKIVNEYGQADAFLGANVMCHIPYLHSIVEGIKLLLKPEGIVMFEDPYLGDVIEKTSYDQIYDEHAFLFSVHSIQYLFNMHNMELVDVEPQETHGGSMRYIIGHKEKRSVSSNVQKYLEKEKNLGIGSIGTYYMFKNNCEKFKHDLVNLLNDIKKDGKSIAGYAATSKSTTIINYCGITADQLDYICDTTPIKQNKFSPGAHIPVKAYENFSNSYPDYALLFAYNHMEEIMKKETRFVDQGGKWILYVPEVKVLQ
ncbi:MAG: methyltransferase domain-containing protein [Ignavibacteriales bacterium]|nr:methyltransferase domain-containing protein [Ignavibacteriales bacterium]